MKVLNYPAKLLRFAVSELNFGCVYPKDPEKEEIDLESHEVDFSYDIFHSNEKEFLIEIMLDISPGHAKPGYKIFLKSIGIFTINNDIEEREQKDAMLKYSCLPILLGSVRGILMNITSNFMFGTYILPMINIKDFDNARIEAEDENEE